MISKKEIIMDVLKSGKDAEQREAIAYRKRVDLRGEFQDIGMCVEEGPTKYSNNVSIGTCFGDRVTVMQSRYLLSEIKLLSLSEDEIERLKREQIPTVEHNGKTYLKIEFGE